MTKNKQLLRRELSEIHSGAVIPTSVEAVTLIRISRIKKMKSRLGWNSWGCCSFIRDYNTLEYASSSITPVNERLKRENSTDAMASNAVIRIDVKNVPDSFQEEDFLKRYIKFFNELIPGNYIKLAFLGRGEVKKSAPKVYRDAKITTAKNYLYFGFKLNNSSKYTIRLMNLASLSFIRHLQFGAYWFFIKDLMDLRSDKSLKYLNNLEIYQLAAFSNTTSSPAISMYPGPYYYKSPISGRQIAYQIESNPNVILKNIEYGGQFSALNRLFHKPTPTAYNLTYLRTLFENKEYLKIYECLKEEFKNGVRGNLIGEGGVELKLKVYDDTELIRNVNGNRPFNIVE